MTGKKVLIWIAVCAGCAAATVFLLKTLDEQVHIRQSLVPLS
jgi:hypothetical protein